VTRTRLAFPLVLALLTPAACGGGATPPADEKKAEKKADPKADEEADEKAEPAPAPNPVAVPAPVPEPEPAPAPEPEPDAKEPDTKKPAPDVEAGKALYMKKCKSCHGPDGAGNPKVKDKYEIPSLIGTKESKAQIVRVTKKGVKGTKMKPYAKKLSDEEIASIADFIKTL
jgi:mono/diheme cytochrome c family protein